jgi:hypothetical protein
MKRWMIGLALAGCLAVAAPAAAGLTPQHFRFRFPEQRVDTTTCAFPVVFSFVFTNDGTVFFDDAGVIQSLQLHQSRVGTVVGNGVTFKEDEHTQTFVTFTDGNATQAIHVGTIVHLVGPNGRLVDIAGQQVFEVENGFDHTLISEHGVDFDFASDAAVCAAFS